MPRWLPALLVNLNRSEAVLRTMYEIQKQADEAVLSEVKKGLSRGMTQAQVAKAMGVSASTLCRFLQKKGWQVERRLIESR